MTVQIFALNGNLFGPGTGGTFEEALRRLAGTGFRPVFEFTQVESGYVQLLQGSRMSFEAIALSGACLTPASSFEEAVSVEPPNFISREQLAFVDLHPGGRLSTLRIASNYPVMLQDYQHFSVFDTSEFRLVENASQLRHKTIWAHEAHAVMCFEDVLFENSYKPLQKDGQYLDQSRDFFIPCPERVQAIEAVRVIDDPILFMQWESAGNYNIFIHELAPEAGLLERLGDKVKILVGPEIYKQEVLAALGVPPERILVATGPLHLRCALLPIRKLNLKYVGPLLLGAYRKIRENLRASSLPLERGKVFLNRRTVSENTGANRFIVNQLEMDERLSEAGFRSVYAEKMSLGEKYSAISGAEVVVSPIGANLVNLGLSESVDKIVLITSPAWGHFKWYWYFLLKKLHPRAEVELFVDCSIEDNGASLDPFNKPFRVNLEALGEILL